MKPSRVESSRVESSDRGRGRVGGWNHASVGAYMCQWTRLRDVQVRRKHCRRGNVWALSDRITIPCARRCSITRGGIACCCLSVRIRRTRCEICASRVVGASSPTIAGNSGFKKMRGHEQRQEHTWPAQRSTGILHEGRVDGSRPHQKGDDWFAFAPLRAWWNDTVSSCIERHCCRSINNNKRGESRTRQAT